MLISVKSHPIIAAALVLLVSADVCYYWGKWSDEWMIHPLITVSPPSSLKEEKPFQDKPSNVLVWIESTPPGAAIVRVSDNFILGHTPETVEFNRTSRPVSIRLELDGYDVVTREVSVDSDGSMTVVLKPNAFLHNR